MNKNNEPDRVDHGSQNCSGGGEAHEAHMEMNGDCPWCASYDKSKWL
jgi:hypothetical protein